VCAFGEKRFELGRIGQQTFHARAEELVELGGKAVHIETGIVQGVGEESGRQSPALHIRSAVAYLAGDHVLLRNHSDGERKRVGCRRASSIRGDPHLGCLIEKRAATPGTTRSRSMRLAAIATRNRTRAGDGSGGERDPARARSPARTRSWSGKCWAAGPTRWDHNLDLTWHLDALPNILRCLCAARRPGRVARAQRPASRLRDDR